jgi:hypothetical protein
LVGVGENDVADGVGVVSLLYEEGAGQFVDHVTLPEMSVPLESLHLLSGHTHKHSIFCLFLKSQTHTLKKKHKYTLAEDSWLKGVF